MADIRRISIRRKTLLVLCGTAGCGKSTFAARRFLPTQVVSSDACRAMICDDETNQYVNGKTFDLFHYIIDLRLQLRRFTVADSTALRPFARRRLLEQAHRCGYSACLLIFNVSLETCLERDSQRPRSVGKRVVQNQFELLQKALIEAPNEGWDELYVLDESEVEVAEIEIINASGAK